MTKIIFIREQYAEKREQWTAISEDMFQSLYISECYDDYGQTIGNDQAGDYLEILTQEAANFAADNDENENVWNVGDLIHAYDHYTLFKECEGEDGFNATYLECQAYTYWDGHTHKSVIIQDDHCGYFVTHEIADDETARKLRARMNFARYVSKEFGIRKYTHGVQENNFQGSIGKYQITLNA